MSVSPIAARVSSQYSLGSLAQHADPDHRAAQHADQVGVAAEQRHHERERQHARQDEEVHRRHRHGGERLDLLVHLHGAELGGKAGAGAPGHDDAGHDRRQLAHRRDGDQVGDVDAGAELLELHGAHEGDDQADQEVDQRDDAQRIRPALLQHEQDVAPLEDRRAAQEAPEGQGGLTQEPGRR